LESLLELLFFVTVNLVRLQNKEKLCNNLRMFYCVCAVVLETAVSPKSTAKVNACIAIGFAVFVAHVLLIPVDGCSINPARSFGPAMISYAR